MIRGGNEEDQRKRRKRREGVQFHASHRWCASRLLSPLTIHKKAENRKETHHSRTEGRGEIFNGRKKEEAGG